MKHRNNSFFRLKSSFIRFHLFLLSFLFVLLLAYTRKKYAAALVSSTLHNQIGADTTYDPQPNNSFRVSSSSLTAKIKKSADAQPFSDIHNVMAHRRATAPNLYITSPTLPPWLIDYFAWHETQRRRSPHTESNYLILSCHTKCGGIARRLGGIPFYLHLANITGRVLLIDWSVPMPLTEFLVPPQGGMDWTVPDGLKYGDDNDEDAAALSCDGSNIGEYYDCFLKVHSKNDSRVLTITPSFSLKTTSTYFENCCVPKYDESDTELDGEIFRILFEPSPPLFTRLNSTTSSLKLIPNMYVSAHFRSMYPPIMRIYSKVPMFIVLENAVRCGSLLMLNAPVYLALDNENFLRMVLEKSMYSKRVRPPDDLKYAHNQYPIHMVSRVIPPKAKTKKINWQLDHDGGSKDGDGVPAKSFYPIFEDLLVMASGRCTTYGVGDYGLFAARLTGNMYFCSWNHQYESGHPTGYCEINGVANNNTLDSE